MLKEGNGEFETQLQDLQFEAEELGMILGI
jgi:hypothetical protein